MLDLPSMQSRPAGGPALSFGPKESAMLRRFSWIGLVLVFVLLGAGCAGDEKGVNQNKEKPQPAAK
jgi:hypothetical protein